MWLLKAKNIIRHRSFNTKCLPFRFEIQPQDEIEDIQVDPFSSLPPTMSSFIVPSAFTSLAFDHQPSSMPSSPAFQGVKQRPPKMGSLNREASQRQLIDSSDLFMNYAFLTYAIRAKLLLIGETNSCEVQMGQ